MHRLITSVAAIVLAACSVLTFSVAAGAQTPIVLTGADMRPSTSLNGEWHYIVDPYFTGLYSFHGAENRNGWFRNRAAQSGDAFPTEYDFSSAPTLTVPGDWNTQEQQLFFYEGPMWYERDFEYMAQPGHREYLRVGAANYKSIFWVNGERVCDHEGGFTAFACDVTSALKPGANFVVAAVDSTRREDGIPTVKTDWYNYGGLTREVSLIEVPQAFIDQYDVHLSRSKADEIDGWVHVMGATGSSAAGSSVTVTIPELGATTTATVGPDGRAPIALTVKGLDRWSPEHPRLYDVRLSVGADSITDKIGFRTIETRGNEILLNGKPVFLKGISIHAEAPYRTGRAWSDQDAETLLGWARELGCNYVRLAHYPHDESMLRAADRLGLMVWAENPVYWAVEFDNPAVYAKATQQLNELVNTQRNHAAVILWSMANETPNTPARTEFITKLAAHARELDGSRLITAALLVRAEGSTKVVDDPLGSALDVIGTNEYIGWYEQHPEGADTTTWRIAYDKPLIMSEFGGGAQAGLHGPDNQRWTEEYQANIYRHQFTMLNKIPQLRGMSPWVLMDFRSATRVLAGVQDYFNRKGLISDQGQKKQAFYVLQEAYKKNLVGKAE